MLVTAALGSPEGVRAVLGVVPADNGSELSDEAALAAAIGERPCEVRLYSTTAARTARTRRAGASGTTPSCGRFCRKAGVPSTSSPERTATS